MTFSLSRDQVFSPPGSFSFQGSSQLSRFHRECYLLMQIFMFCVIIAEPWTQRGTAPSARLVYVFFPPLSRFWRNSADTNIFLCVSEIITCCELYWRCLDAFGGPFFADNQFMIFLCVFCFVLFSLVPADSLNVKQWCEKHWEQSGFKKNRKQAKNAAPRSTRSSVLLKRPS